MASGKSLEKLRTDPVTMSCGWMRTPKGRAVSRRIRANVCSWSRTELVLRLTIPKAPARLAAAAIARPSLPSGARANTRGRQLLVTDVCSQVAGI